MRARHGIHGTAEGALQHLCKIFDINAMPFRRPQSHDRGTGGANAADQPPDSGIDIMTWMCVSSVSVIRCELARDFCTGCNL